MSLESLALLMKILGAAVSLVSGMTAIFNVTWSGRKLTGWGWSVLMDLLLGFGFSAAGTVRDAKVKQLDDVATKVRNDATLAQLASIKKAAQTHYIRPPLAVGFP
jgi:hypothetical protein